MRATKVLVSLKEGETIPFTCGDCPFVTTNVNQHYDIYNKQHFDDDFFCGIMDRPDDMYIVTGYVINEEDPLSPPFFRAEFCPLEEDENPCVY